MYQLTLSSSVETMIGAIIHFNEIPSNEDDSEMFFVDNITKVNTLVGKHFDSLGMQRVLVDIDSHGLVWNIPNAEDAMSLKLSLPSYFVIKHA